MTQPEGIPKPEGNELRTRRADKSSSARDVIPMDALFDAYERIKDNPKVRCLVVCWYETAEDGLPLLKWSAAADHPRGIVALIADAAYETQLAARTP